EFHKVLSSQDNNIDAINGLYDLAYWNNNYEDAVTAAEMGIKFYPDSGKYYIQKAKALNARDTDEAIAYLGSIKHKIKNSSAIKSYLKELNLLKEEKDYNKNNPSSDSLFIAARKEAYIN